MVYQVRQAKKTLTRTKAKILDSSKFLRRHISYRQLCRRTRRGKLGFDKPTSEVDKCSICCSYGFRMKGELDRGIDTVLKTARAFAPHVDPKWKEIVKANAAFNAENFDRACSPSYFDGLLTVLKEAYGAMVGADDADELALSAFVSLMSKMENMKVEAEKFSTHFGTNENQRSSLVQMQKVPSTMTLHVLWDFEEFQFVQWELYFDCIFILFLFLGEGGRSVVGRGGEQLGPSIALLPSCASPFGIVSPSLFEHIFLYSVVFVLCCCRDSFSKILLCFIGLLGLVPLSLKLFWGSFLPLIHPNFVPEPAFWLG